jgi:putative phosphoribosyl transferase
METLGPEVTGFLPAHLAEGALFDDRADAGRRLAQALPDDLEHAVVLGTTAGGVEIGAEVAHALHGQLDIVVVAPVWQTAEHEHAVGAAAPGDAVYLREGEPISPTQAVVAVARAHREAARLEAVFHEHFHGPAIEGRDLVLVDEAITTGATMAAAIVWARGKGARRIVAAVPVAAAAGLAIVRELADGVVCLYEFEVIGSRAVWFGDFPRLEQDEVRRLLEATR